MKRLGRVVLGMVLVVALGACSAKPSALGSDDSGSSVGLAVGESLTIELPANPSTGYAWVVVEPGPFDDPGEPEYVADEHLKNTVGAGGVDRFVVTRTSPEAGSLVLEYRRSWESTDVAAEDTWSIDVSSAGE